MSQNVAEGNAAFVIWSNECLDWDNWSEAFEEDYANLTEEEKYRLMEERNGDYLDDERRNLDIRVGTPILILADIGRWDGRHTGYREIESGCIKDCLYSQLDGVAWYVDTQGDLRMDGYHHDGHNYYLYRKYRQGVSEEAKENFKEKILDHTLTKRILTGLPSGWATTLPRSTAFHCRVRQKSTGKGGMHDEERNRFCG